MIPAVEGSEPSGHPNGRKATVGLVAPVCKTGLCGAPLVQLQLRPHSNRRVAKLLHVEFGTVFE